MSSTPEVVKGLRTIPHRSVQTQQIEERLRTMAVGEIATYQELNALTHGDVQGKDGAYMRSAINRLLKDGLVFNVVRTVGVKREDDSGKLATVKTRRQNIHRACGKTLRVAAATEHKNLTSAQSQELNIEQACVGVVYQMTTPTGIKRFEPRVATQGILPGDITVPQVL
jgi:hypothetical protein